MKRGGYTRTPEILKKQSLVQVGKKRVPFTDEHKKNIAISKIGNQNGKGLLGKKKTQEHKDKIRDARKKQIMPKGEKSYRWKGGKKPCIDCGKKTTVIAENTRCRECYFKFNVGENHHGWKGGYSSSYPTEFNAKLKLKIRTRDNFICLICGRTEREELEEMNRVLCVNHIDFDKKNCKENNLNTLCLRCNVKINRDREYWTNYFMS